MPAYVYAIRDPETDKIVFVGTSQTPWVSVQLHLQDSSNPAMRDWARDLAEKYPEGIEILDSIVCDAYEGEDVVYPEVGEGRTRIVWEILDTEPERQDTAAGVTIIPLQSRKKYWMDRLIKEGHPIKNRQPGRPAKEGRSLPSSHSSPGKIILQVGQEAGR